MLSEDVIEGDEAYEFTWVGKKASIAEANKSIRKTLRPCPAESRDWDTTENLYIEGDNLEVLKLLQENYMGRVKMIYIDPPYNTGNDFIYSDYFKMSAAAYGEQIGMFDEERNVLFRENSRANPRFHSDWCRMIYPRLLLARTFLCDSGLIFISIDENEITNLRKICDEVFGARQFVAQITLLCNPKGRSQDKYVANCHEYILIYSKCELSAGSVSIYKSKDEIAKDYPLTDAFGNRYRELELRNTHRDFGRFNRPSLWYPIYAYPDGSVVLEPDENTQIIYPTWDDGFEGCWTWSKDKARKYLHLLIAREVNGKMKVYRKAFAYSQDEAPYKQVKSIWADKAFYTERGQAAANGLFGSKAKLFPSPKSVELICRCIEMAQAKDALVMDFFSGSATTAHAVMQLNAQDGGKRKFILVQLPEPCDENSEAYKAGYKNICEIGKERIRRAGDKIKAENPAAAQDLDIGFRVFKVDDSNMEDVYYAADDIDQQSLSGMVSNIKPDRSSLDLLFGCLLDWGLPLSLPYTSETIEGCTVHTYNGGDLAACFDEDVPESVIREIARRKPRRAVFRDGGFSGSPAKINVTEIFKMLAPDTRVRVI